MLMRTSIALSLVAALLLFLSPASSASPFAQLENKVTCDKGTVGACSVSIDITEINEIPGECICTNCRKIKVKTTMTCGSSTCTRSKSRCDDASGPVTATCGGVTVTHTPTGTWGNIFDNGTCDQITTN